MRALRGRHVGTGRHDRRPRRSPTDRNCGEAYKLLAAERSPDDMPYTPPQPGPRRGDSFGSPTRSATTKRRVAGAYCGMWHRRPLHAPCDRTSCRRRRRFGPRVRHRPTRRASGADRTGPGRPIRSERGASLSNPRPMASHTALPTRAHGPVRIETGPVRADPPTTDRRVTLGAIHL